MRQPIRQWFFLLAPLAICLSLGLQQESIGAEEDTTPGAPRLLPKDTLAYIRIDNVDDMRTDMAASSMGRMMNDPQASKPFVSEVYSTLGELFEQFWRANRLVPRRVACHSYRPSSSGCDAGELIGTR